MGKQLVVPDLKFTVSIKGQRWKINVYTVTKFDKFSPGDVGLTSYNHKKGLRSIHFRGRTPSRDTIAHELLHAYLSYYDFSRTSYGKIEESICEEIGKSYKRLFELVLFIHEKCRKGRKCK